ncbi:MAG: PEP-CTERM sorting domain-containing protein [Verrucomicrobiales bacterium]|nr:PEP-CTERM sorting domain-containing protein [Verrucomicrobiales bacterium]
MKLVSFLKNSLSTFALCLVAQAAQAQHGHLEVGAAGQNQNDKLVWENGAAFASDSGYVKELLPSDPAGRYAGYYDGGITVVANGSTEGGAALGAFVRALVVSVVGPVGGSFGFWENPEEGGSTTPTFVVPSGTSNGTFGFDLSDASAGAGLPGKDAAGHLHGRRFTVDVAGEYLVGFKAIDTSKNGVGGGAIQADSDILYIKFATVPEPGTLALGALGLGSLCLLRSRRSVR